jgi:hypothetical protein
MRAPAPTFDLADLLDALINIPSAASDADAMGVRTMGHDTTSPPHLAPLITRPTGIALGSFLDQKMRLNA